MINKSDGGRRAPERSAAKRPQAREPAGAGADGKRSCKRRNGAQVKKGQRENHTLSLFLLTNVNPGFTFDLNNKLILV